MGANVAAHQSSLSSTDQDSVRKIGEYLIMRRSMKGAAIGSLMWGLILVMLLWGTGGGLDLVTVVLWILGLVLLVDGILLLYYPRSFTFVFSGICLFLVGLWNIAFTVALLTHGADTGHFWGALGVMQIGWGVRELRRALRFRQLARIAEDADVLDSVSAAIAHDIPKAAAAWTLRTPNRARPMQSNDTQGPLKDIIGRILRGLVPLDRAVLLRPEADSFEYFCDVPELAETLSLLQETTSEIQAETSA